MYICIVLQEERIRFCSVIHTLDTEKKYLEIYIYIHVIRVEERWVFIMNVYIHSIIQSSFQKKKDK